MTGSLDDRLDPLVRLLYPADHAEVTARLLSLAATYRPQLDRRAVTPPTEATVCLITYADAFRRPDEAPIPGHSRLERRMMRRIQPDDTSSPTKACDGELLDVPFS